MAGDYGREPDDYSIVNVMLPRRYHPPWQDSVFERRARDVAVQLQGDGMELDYDQLLAKQPFKDDAVFAWHQDMAYWPDTPDTRTATIWLAIDDSTLENGCMRFVPATITRAGAAAARARVRRAGRVARARHRRCATATRSWPCRSGAATAPCTTSV